LTWNERAQRAFNEIEADWFGSDLDRSGPLSCIGRYSGQLAEAYGDTVMCEWSYPWLCEAFYPVDFSLDAVRALSSGAEIEQIETSLARRPKTILGLSGHRRLVIGVIGANSD
jgi:hypothetical protein